ncbi:MAG: hypothetical protein J7L55_03340 [Desulfurococcales archaeon]|nr:hypothetical protein [Desulfurococcales archaeon]
MVENEAGAPMLKHIIALLGVTALVMQASLTLYHVEITAPKEITGCDVLVYKAGMNIHIIQASCNNTERGFLLEELLENQSLWKRIIGAGSKGSLDVHFMSDRITVRWSAEWEETYPVLTREGDLVLIFTSIAITTSACYVIKNREKYEVD